MDLEQKIDDIFQSYCHSFESFSKEIDEYSKWFYSLDNLTIDFSNETKSASYSIIPVGTYSKEYGTFLWGWANKGWSENTKNAAIVLKELHNEFGFNAFLQEGFSCKEEELDEILSLSLYGLNGMTIFKIKDEDPWLFLCIVKNA